MKSFDGYLKLKLGDNYVLLAGGGHIALSNMLNAAGLNLDSTTITTGAAGWYKLAYYSSTDPRGSVRIGLVTVGGDFAPHYAELYVKNGWENIDMILYGCFEHISKFRFTSDSTKCYIEGYFPTANTVITLRKIKGIGYASDNMSDWVLYTTATAGSGTVQDGEKTRSSVLSGFYTNRSIEGSGFIKTGSSDSYVLLGGGGHKAVSDFLTSDTLYFKYRGIIDTNYVDLATYTANATNYQNPYNGIWNVQRSNHTASLITFTGGGSASGLDLYFDYSKGSDFKFRRRVDSNRLSGAWETFITSENWSSYCAAASHSHDVYWKDVKDKIRYGNEFDIVPSGYNGAMWFNYRSDANTNVTVLEYVFGNGSNSASASIRSGTVYPGANASYNIGKNDSRWNYGYFCSAIVIGSTSYTSGEANDIGTTIAKGFIEMSATNPYIDFHKSGLYTNDYSSRLIHESNRDRLYYACYNSTYSGYVATCEGNLNNLTIIGVFDLYKINHSTTTWNISTICGPCSFTLQQSNSNTDVSFKNQTSSVQSWTISSNILRVYVNAPSSDVYASKSTPYAVSCDARVMTRWINNQPVVTNCLHGGDWLGSSIECLCTNLSSGSSLYYYSNSPGRYIYITSSRPWGYDNGSNGLGMDMMRRTGDLSYLRIRFTVFGYIS